MDLSRRPPGPRLGAPRRLCACKLLVLQEVVGANGFEPSTSWSRTRHLNPINALFGVAYGTRSAISPLLVVPNLYLAQKGSCASARSFRFAASIRSRLPWRLLALSLEAPPCRFPGSGERRCRAGALGW